jgi:hypothetical protein
MVIGVMLKDKQMNALSVSSSGLMQFMAGLFLFLAANQEKYQQFIS